MATKQHVEAESCEKTVKKKLENSVLDNFTKLTNGDEKIRIKGGIVLLKHLTNNDHEEKTEDELKYALSRLIRGLGSANIYTKMGFFTALVGLLHIKSVPIGLIFNCIETQLHKSGSNSKSENADVCLGQILVSGAILRSNLYDRCDDEYKIKMLELLFKIGKERTYLTLASYKFLTGLYKKIDYQEFEKIVFPIIKPELCKSWEEQDLDSLYLLAETQIQFPKIIKAKFLKKNVGTSEILSVDSLNQICNVLTSIPRFVALNHPVFELFSKKVTESDLIVQFFQVLDQIISKANRNKYFVFAKLLSSVLENLTDKAIIPDILTRNYLQQTIMMYKTSVGKHKDKQFQQMSETIFETLLSKLKSEDAKTKTKLKILKRLMFYPGTFIFEKITKTKLIQNITATLDTEGVKKLSTVYRDVVLAKKGKAVNENTFETWWNMERIYASHLLVKLINHPSTLGENHWKVEQLLFLMKLGLLNESENVGHELAESLKHTFYLALDLKLVKLDDLRTILSKIVQELDKILTGTVIRHHRISDEIYQTWKRTVELATKLETSAKKRNVVFHILFLHLGLQLLNDSKMASDSLEELFNCYERVKKSKKNEVNSTADDPLWIEVIVDLFLNLLSHNSHLLRSIINYVFPHLCKYMSVTAIHHVLSVIDPTNENPLSMKQEEDESDDNEGDECSEGDTSSSEEEIEDENDNVRLRMALQQALGNNVETDVESIDLDNLSDEEGERLNQALGDAFKQFKPNCGRKTKQNRDEETLTHFRLRVLDLIEIYLNSNPSMILSLEIMLPLLKTLEFSIRDEHQQPLENRVRACLKKLSSLKKFNGEDVTEEILADLLKSLLEKGAKNAIIIQGMGEKIAECCIFVIGCSQIVGQRTLITKVIANSLEAFFKKRDCLVPYVLFKNVMQLNWKGILDLIPILFSFIFTDSLRPFRRNQAVELLKLFYNNHRFHNSHLEEIKGVEECTLNWLARCEMFFREFSENPKEGRLKDKFVGSLFELLSEIKNSVLANSFKNWDAIADASCQCRSYITLSKDTKVAFNKLCRNLNVSNLVQMKQNPIKLNNREEDVCENVVEKPAKKKKTKNLKLKKEAKELRLQILSEGFSKRKIDWDDSDTNKKTKYF